MHLARRAWCRAYQTVFRIALPILPYTEPRILEHAEDVPAVLQTLDPEGPYRDRPWYCTFGAHGITRARAYGSGDCRYGLCRNACEPHGLECGGSGGAVSRERLPGHYRLWWRFGHGLRQGCGGAHCAAKQAHQQDARPVARSSSPAAAYCGSHYCRYGK